MGINIIMPERLNGLRKTDRGIYVPTKETIGNYVKKHVPSLENLPARYVEQGNEKKILEASRKGQKAVLLSGPTGVGKTLLVKEYAAEKEMPLLILTASEDLTDGKIRGTSDLLVVPAFDENKNAYDLKIKSFSPTHLTLAGMSDLPLVLFVDELHKVRSGVSSLFHSITNERMVYCHELTGENYMLHPDTLVVAAVNPSYGEGGIDRLDPALRQRFTTIDLQMPVGDVLKAIVESNIGESDYKRYEPLIEALVKVQGEIVNALKRADKSESTATIDPRLAEPATINSVIEAPSPRSIVDTVKQVITGLPAMVAAEVQMVNQIITDFGGPKKALLTIIEEHLPKEFRK
jgi:MoxR-like ATPase